MNLTAKAVKEVAVIEAKIAEIKKEEMKLQAKRDNCSDYQIQKLIRRELDREYDKQFKAEAKLKTIQERGFSTSEATALKKEMREGHMQQFGYERSLGCTSITKIGFSKVLNSYVKISYTRWSGFMANVRGCGSLANTVDLDKVEILTEAEHFALLNKERTNTVSFMGTQTTVLPALNKA